MKIKTLLGDLPYTAELYWHLRQRNHPTTVNMSLKRLKKVLPDWHQQALDAREYSSPGKNILIFGMVRYWIEHTVLIGLTLAGMGHNVTLAYLPYAHWKKDANRFDLRRQNSYIQNVLSAATPLVTIVPLFGLGRNIQLPESLSENLLDRAFRDTQYSMLLDEVEKDSDLYRLRLERDRLAACAGLSWLTKNQTDVVITPNGSILEFGVMFQIAHHLGIPVMTYEFGEQNHRIWLAQNADVMRQETDLLWAARGEQPLTEQERNQIRSLFESRQGGKLWQTFARAWQGIEAQGGEQVRADLGLDERPLAFLPTNVLGDSLTLGRQIFSGMTEWLRQTIRYFIEHPKYQLVVRVHPGEQKGWGPSVYDILCESFPTLPENIHLLPADAQVNSYDLIEAADLGLVYTTTMGMEMAMSGQTVIVTGQTHYRSKGFTHDPDTWEDFYQTVEKVLRDPTAHRLTSQQIDLAWRYAHRFFFEYPQPFPWHLVHYWDELDEWPIRRVLSEEGQRQYRRTFRYLAGEPIDWHKSQSGIDV